MDYKQRLTTTGVAPYDQPYAYRPDAKFTKETPSNVRLVAQEFKPYRITFDSSDSTRETVGNADTFEWPLISIPRHIKKGKLFLERLIVQTDAAAGAVTNALKISLTPFVHPNSYDTTSKSTSTAITSMVISASSSSMAPAPNPDWEFVPVFNITTFTPLRLRFDQLIPTGTIKIPLTRALGSIVILDESDE